MPKTLDTLTTDDEFHFTDGTKYTCRMDGDLAYMFPGSKMDGDDFDHMWDSDRLYVSAIRGMLTDALAGGAKIVSPI
jgi:hypothetical protein